MFPELCSTAHQTCCQHSMQQENIMNARRNGITSVHDFFKFELWTHAAQSYSGPILEVFSVEIRVNLDYEGLILGVDNKIHDRIHVINWRHVCLQLHLPPCFYVPLWKKCRKCYLLSSIRFGERRTSLQTKMEQLAPAQQCLHNHLIFCA